MSTSIYLFAGTYTWGQFAPVFYLVGLAVLLLLADSFLPRLNKQVFPIIGAIGAFVTGCFMFKGAYASPVGLVVCMATALALVMLREYRAVAYASVAGGSQEDGSAELTPLMLIACAGACALTQARDLVMLFVSLETLTLSSYAMAGYFRRNQGSIEAGVKYLILGAVSTGMLVMGAAWYIGSTGTFLLMQPGVYETALISPFCTGFLVAMGLLLAGAFFKVGAVPMHTWIPDVYQGAPTPVSAFLAVASKMAGFMVLLQLCAPLVQVKAGSPVLVAPLQQALAVVAALTLLVGNLGAIRQTNVKRLLGYSSIGQAGFILIFFAALQRTLFTDVWYYMVVYGLATMAAFFAVAQVRMQRGSEELSAFNGLGKTNPRIAFLLTVAFASLAGVPLTGGFLAKWGSFRALISSVQQGDAGCMGCWLLPVMIICATAGFYYYFKVLRAMYWEAPREEDAPLAVSPATAVALTLCALALIGSGTLPLIFR